ncbi:flagellar hook capping protein [Croceicoccus estronivorus]|uniref:flagellar hook assembly protein FlgD n=1 Tax=Croceicoccus estronivorus TaxID=1172626 RepID=UPI000833E14C|nr:flagellar hook capping FlgD N-terminal domain-containing protein [Croceicoccus estronivorus]OCC22932.1 flagellar hook capping protein [Croceicoccus estronivorus]
MATSPIEGLANVQTDSGANQGAQNATDAFGLSFESLLKIVLTQLTYQDPLKPMDNFEFVSQLAQFSQIQQTQDMSQALQTLVAAQSSSQAASLLGKTVDVPASGITLSGEVTAVSFIDGSPSLTIRTTDNQTISNIALNAVSQIREGN